MSETINGIPGDWGTLSNTGGAANLGAMLGDPANSSLVARLGLRVRAPRSAAA